MLELTQMTGILGPQMCPFPSPLPVVPDRSAKMRQHARRGGKDVVEGPRRRRADFSFFLPLELRHGLYEDIPTSRRTQGG